jgi:hypothetical protein
MGYNHDSGSWTLCPANKQQSHYNLQKGQSYNIELTIYESFGKAEIINIVNLSFLIVLVLHILLSMDKQKI